MGFEIRDKFEETANNASIPPLAFANILATKKWATLTLQLHCPRKTRERKRERERERNRERENEGERERTREREKSGSHYFLFFSPSFVVWVARYFLSSSSSPNMHWPQLLQGRLRDVGITGTNVCAFLIYFQRNRYFFLI